MGLPEPTAAALLFIYNLHIFNIIHIDLFIGGGIIFTVYFHPTSERTISMKHRNLKQVLLPSALLLALLISCGDGGNAADTSADTTSVSGGETEAVTEAGYPAPDTTGLDFGGEEFRFLTPEWGSFWNYFPDEMTGESYDDALYNRISNVQNELNVKIVNTWSIDANLHTDLMKSVMAGDDAHDAAFTHMIYGIADMATSKALYNLDDLTKLNFDAPWWKKDMIDYFRIGTETYYAFGDIIISSPTCMFINKGIAAEYDMPDHYQLVRDGKWTYDLFLSEVKSVSVDVNGDGIMGPEDKTGFAGDMTEALSNIPSACGINLTKATDDGLELTFYSDKLVEIFNDTYDVLLNDNYSQGYFRHTESGQDFSDNLALFTITSPGAMPGLREIDMDFGVLPMPKYDEAQANYAGLAWPCFVCVPNTIQRTDLVGATLEQFAYESQDVQTAYMEDLIRGKSTRDEESLEMLDIIFDTQVIEIGANYLGFDQNFHKVFYCFYELMSKKNQNISSHYEKSKDAVQKVLDDLYDKIIENQESNA